MKLKVEDQRRDIGRVEIQFVTFGSIVEMGGRIYQVVAAHRNIHNEDILFNKEKQVVVVNMEHGLIELIGYGREAKILKAELIITGEEDGTETKS